MVRSSGADVGPRMPSSGGGEPGGAFGGAPGSPSVGGGEPGGRLRWAPRRSQQGGLRGQRAKQISEFTAVRGGHIEGDEHAVRLWRSEDTRLMVAVKRNHTRALTARRRGEGGITAQQIPTRRSDKTG